MFFRTKLLTPSLIVAHNLAVVVYTVYLFRKKTTLTSYPHFSGVCSPSNVKDSDMHKVHLLAAGIEFSVYFDSVFFTIDIVKI